VNWGGANDVGAKPYTVTVQSYLSRSHGKLVIDHNVYVNTSAFPWGYTFMFSIRTRRSDGVWRKVRKGGAGIFSFDGRKKIQWLHLRQTRYTPGRTSITRVEVTHCACSLGSGAAPIWSTVGANFGLYRGPTVRPKSR